MPSAPAKCSRVGDIQARLHYEWIRTLTIWSTLRRADLNSVDLGVICRADDERDGDRAGIVGSRVERLLRSGVFTPCRSKDVVTVEHLFVVDVDVEETLARRGPVGFREVQIDNIRAARCEAWDRIG